MACRFMYCFPINAHVHAGLAWVLRHWCYLHLVYLCAVYTINHQVLIFKYPIGGNCELIFCNELQLEASHSFPEVLASPIQIIASFWHVPYSCPYSCRWKVQVFRPSWANPSSPSSTTVLASPLLEENTDNGMQENNFVVDGDVYNHYEHFCIMTTLILNFLHLFVMLMASNIYNPILKYFPKENFYLSCKNRKGKQ